MTVSVMMAPGRIERENYGVNTFGQGGLGMGLANNKI